MVLSIEDIGCAGVGEERTNVCSQINGLKRDFFLVVLRGHGDCNMLV